jgi:hypothetical protein
MAPGNQSRVKYNAEGQTLRTGRQLNEDDLKCLERMRPYEAFVWSSAQPENVWAMVETAFGEYAHAVSPNPKVSTQAKQDLASIPAPDRPGRLLGVWNRTSLGLSSAEFG